MIGQSHSSPTCRRNGAQCSGPTDCCASISSLNHHALQSALQATAAASLVALQSVTTLPSPQPSPASAWQHSKHPPRVPKAWAQTEESAVETSSGAISRTDMPLRQNDAPC